ncbi:MAG: hypothetical protein NZT92_00765 [Abditibacteriales bacterium]|nr:hypothetical protein [Abditibacteriales bacterium]MDW8364613.1 hypothetical protein [Abditibacteriales bacterium]
MKGPLSVSSFPAAGIDSQQCTAQLEVKIGSARKQKVDLTGSVLIKRSNPRVGTNARRVVDMEILSLDLSGTVAGLGSIRIAKTFDPNFPSRGMVQARSFRRDFPADSFFDLFLLWRTPQGVMLPERVLRVTGKVTALPSLDRYSAAKDTNVNLLFPTNNGTLNVGRITGFSLKLGAPLHEAPLLAGTDCLASTATMDVEFTDGSRETVLLAGSTTVARSDPSDLDADGKWELRTEIVAMELFGNSRTLFGPVTLTNNPAGNSVGGMRQRNNGVNFPADSFLDAFLLLQSSFGTIGLNNTAARLTAPDGVEQVIPSVTEPVAYLGAPTGFNIVDPFTNQPMARVVHLLLTLGAPQPCPTTLPTGRRAVNARGNFALEIARQHFPLTAVLRLTGPIVIERGPLADQDSDGRPDTPTEILSMDLTGTFDPNPQQAGDELTIRITQNAARRTLGQTEQRSAGRPFPADSFFDVFFDIQIDDAAGQRVAHLVNSAPMRVQNILFVPEARTPYASAWGASVNLVDAQTGQPAGTLFAVALTPTE